MVPTKHVFPDSFFSEEDRLGFHIDRQRKELWAIELDMLYELDRVCKKLNVKYFLEAGTLLGAARDGLFIPWDDSVRTMTASYAMPRRNSSILTSSRPAIRRKTISEDTAS